MPVRRTRQLCPCSRGRREENQNARQGSTTAAAAAAAATAAATAAAKTVAFVIDGADHALSAPTHAEEFVAKVEAFVARLVD